MQIIITQRFKEHFKGVLYYFTGLLAYAWMMIGLFPSVSSVKDAYSKAMPENMLKVFGAEGFSSLTTIEGFLSLEFLSLFFILILAFFVGSSAGSAIAGQIEKKTIDFSLSQPISRTKFLLSEIIVTLSYSILIVGILSVIMFFLSKTYHDPLSGSGVFAFAAIATAFLLAIYGIGIFLSSLMKSKISVAGGTVLIVVAFYILTAMTKIVDKLKDYDKFSLFYLYNPQKLLESGEINLNHLFILLAIAFIGILSSILIFNKKGL